MLGYVRCVGKGGHNLIPGELVVFLNLFDLISRGKSTEHGGDINSWRTKIGSHAPYNYLYSKGFRDSTRAPRKIDARYPTINHWKKTLNPNRPGRQVAIDVIMLNRGKTFRTYENVMKVVDSSRPSDHNMVVSDLVL